MEMRDRGLRIRAMKRKGDAITKKSTDDDGTVMMENPTRAAVEMTGTETCAAPNATKRFGPPPLVSLQCQPLPCATTARKDDEERGAAGAGSATDKSVSTGASSTAADEPPKASGLVLLLWFLIALGNMAPWTAMMSFLGVFKAVFGPAIFLKMNAAYYGPALPVLIMQIQFRWAFCGRRSAVHAVSFQPFDTLWFAVRVCLGPTHVLPALPLTASLAPTAAS